MSATVTVRGMTFTFRRGFPAIASCTAEAWCGQKCPRCGGAGWFDIGIKGGPEIGPEIRHIMEPPKQLSCYTCHGTGRLAGHGPAIVLAAPIEKVTLAEWRGESCRACSAGYVPTDHDDSTCEVCHGLHDSRAALAWARLRAGLPALS